MSEIVIFEDENLKSLPKERSQQIRETFVPMANLLAQYEDGVKEIVARFEAGNVDQQLCNDAKRLRLDIVSVRTSADKARKKLKESVLIQGRAIDGTYNILKMATAEHEQRLENVENFFDNLERERLEALNKERREALAPFIVDPEQLNALDLGGMSDEVFGFFLDGKRKEYEARIEAERKAAEAAEMERIAKELHNERYHLLAPYMQYVPKEVPTDLSQLSQEDWGVLLEQVKADKKAEQDRLAELERQEAERKENERKERQYQSDLHDERFSALLKHLGKDHTPTNTPFMGAWSSAEYNQYFDQLKQAKADRIAKAEAEQAAADARAELLKKEQAEKAEQERLAKEEEARKKAGDKWLIDELATTVRKAEQLADPKRYKSAANKKRVSEIQDTLKDLFDDIQSVFNK